MRTPFRHEPISIHELIVMVRVCVLLNYIQHLKFNWHKMKNTQEVDTSFTANASIEYTAYGVHRLMDGVYYFNQKNMCVVRNVE